MGEKWGWGLVKREEKSREEKRRDELRRGKQKERIRYNTIQIKDKR